MRSDYRLIGELCANLLLYAAREDQSKRRPGGSGLVCRDAHVGTTALGRPVEHRRFCRAGQPEPPPPARARQAKDLPLERTHRQSYTEVTRAVWNVSAFWGIKESCSPRAPSARPATVAQSS